MSKKKTNKKIIPDFSINFIAMSPEPRAPKISAEACPGAAASPSQAVTDGWGELLKIWGITIKQMWNHPNNASKMGINLKMGESTTIKKCPKMVDLTIKHG